MISLADKQLKNKNKQNNTKDKCNCTKSGGAITRHLTVHLFIRTIFQCWYTDLTDAFNVQKHKKYSL